MVDTAKGPMIPTAEESPPDPILDPFWQRFLPAIEDEIKSVLDSADHDYRLYYGMMAYHLGWVDDAFRPGMERAGKRIRPFVCLLVCSAAGGEWRWALPAAAAIELLHNFSLIHDDIEDDSATRRSRPTVWSLWGIPQAINAGDSMFALAYHALTRLSRIHLPPDAVAQIWQIFTEACIHLTKGQHLDMLFETQNNVTVEDYLKMIAGKTAALLAATTQIGAIVGAADRQAQMHYGAFGRNVGLAFQAYDDILGVWGDEDETGKSTASDILARKKTLPILYGLSQSAELREHFAEHELDVDRVVQLMDSVGAKRFALEIAQQYSDAALAHLDAARPSGEAGAALRLLTAQLIRRRS
jgi:geranylgeranyl diphosphate synthase type I